MSGAGLDDLTWPSVPFNPRHNQDFISRETCVRHDQKQAAALRSTITLPGLVTEPREVRRLASLLDDTQIGDVHPYCRASEVYRMSARARIGGRIHQLLAESIERGEHVSFVTLCPRGGDVAPEDVASFDPRSFGRQLGACLDRNIVKSRINCRTGWSILFLEAEYQLLEHVFRFHWHGFATGDELAAIRNLRTLRDYRSPNALPGEDRDSVRHRVKGTYRRLSNLGYLCGYLLKRWRCRPVLSNQAGNRERTWPADIPLPLIPIETWFRDKWSTQNVAVVRGLRVVEGRLRERRPARE